MPAQPWYLRYDEYREEVQQRKERFEERCASLGIDPQKVLREKSLELIARAVQESNWQEGLYLDEYHTRQLANAAFRELMKEQNLVLDMDRIIEEHRLQILDMQRRGQSIEEIASYNLSKAYLMLHEMQFYFLNRRLAAVYKVFANFREELTLWNEGVEPLFEVLDDFLNQVEQVLGVRDHASQEALKLLKEQKNQELLVRSKSDIIKSITSKMEVLYHHVTASISNSVALGLPYKGNITTRGDLIKALINENVEDLVQTMNVDYIHFLHRLTMMGILSPDDCGVFRDTPVFITGVDIHLPPPSAVPALMQHFCQSFPTTDKHALEQNDIIVDAASVSYEFVKIHPYIDGNGRMSRLLMNSILLGFFPIVYLKADSEGRRKYGYALKRANRGQLLPLAALIAKHLISVYDKVIDSLTPSSS